IRCGKPSEATDIEPGSLDLVVANPPYIPSGVVGTLETQVKDYEPVMALDGGADGLGIFRILLSGLPHLMSPGGALLCETGGGAQVGEIVTMAGEASPELSVEKIYRDHRDIERYILWRRTA
ncbi:MAG: hypothetical protein LBU26_07020, partial [Synergistaceae bacterium]|nr:hypothetical protein [Synergistaceae bacterium]